MTLHRKTNYIIFISGMSTSGTAYGERIEALKEVDGWHIINQEGRRYMCPINTLRIMLEQAQDVRQFDNYRGGLLA